MSKLLADLLAIDRRDFEAAIARLEHMTQKSSMDVRLSVAVQSQLRRKTQQLQLDPADTPPRELYYALLAKASLDDQLLRSAAKLEDTDSLVAITEKLSAILQPLVRKDVVLALQPAALRKVLKSVPPKKTLRLLKFRSLEAVLKRADPFALYALATKIEDKTWHKQLYARLKRLESRDVGEHAVRFITIPNTWAQKVDSALFKHYVHVLPEVGAIILLPTPRLQLSGAVLLACGVALQASQKLCVESLPFRMRALHTGIEAQIAAISSGETHALAPVHGMQFSWHVVYYSLAKHSSKTLLDTELIVNDLDWETTEARLATVHSDLGFWYDTHYVGRIDEQEGQVITMHVLDCATNLVLQKRYGQHTTKHLRGSLWNELQAYYAAHEAIASALHEQVL